MHRLSLLDNQFEAAYTAGVVATPVAAPVAAPAQVPGEKKDSLSVTDNRTGRFNQS